MLTGRPMTRPGRLADADGGMEEIVNPLSGERITILASDGDALVWELKLAPGGRVPASHTHPRQQEVFTVLEGLMRFRIGWRRTAAGPGEVVTVPPGRAHHFANAGQVPARCVVRTSPALSMRELLETAAALAQEQQAADRRLPRLSDLLRFMRRFEAEVAAPVLPGLVRLITRVADAIG
jgi:mannose-6-phosphate isomerase-like protein (cupin superfamily)